MQTRMSLWGRLWTVLATAVPVAAAFDPLQNVDQLIGTDNGALHIFIYFAGRASLTARCRRQCLCRRHTPIRELHVRVSPLQRANSFRAWRKLLLMSPVKILEAFRPMEQTSQASVTCTTRELGVWYSGSSSNSIFHVRLTN